MHYNILGEYSHLKLMNTHETDHVQMSLVAALICFRENVPFGKSSPFDICSSRRQDIKCQRIVSL